MNDDDTTFKSRKEPVEDIQDWYLRYLALDIASRDSSGAADSNHVIDTADKYAKFIREGKTSE